jgi:hypothetical protein
MAETELEKITNSVLRASWLLVTVTVLSVGLLNTLLAIVFWIIMSSSIARPSENSNIHIQSSPRTFDDNVRDVLKKEGKVD